MCQMEPASTFFCEKKSLVTMQMDCMYILQNHQIGPASKWSYIHESESRSFQAVKNPRAINNK